MPPGGQPRFWEGPAATGTSGAAGWGLALPDHPLGRVFLASWSHQGCVRPGELTALSVLSRKAFTKTMRSSLKQKHLLSV